MSYNYIGVEVIEFDGLISDRERFESLDLFKISNGKYIVRYKTIEDLSPVHLHVVEFFPVQVSDGDLVYEEAAGKRVTLPVTSVFPEVKNKEGRYHYTESGISIVFLRGGVAQEERDGEMYTSVANIEILHWAIASELSLMTNRHLIAYIKFFDNLMEEKLPKSLFEHRPEDFDYNDTWIDFYFGWVRSVLDLQGYRSAAIVDVPIEEMTFVWENNNWVLECYTTQNPSDHLNSLKKDIPVHHGTEFKALVTAALQGIMANPVYYNHTPERIAEDTLRAAKAVYAITNK